MTDKLLPCPFCGGEATISDGGYSGEKFLARCRDLSCPAASGFIRKTHDEAIAAWNRRADHLPDATKMVSNADRIRKTTDEELAKMLAYNYDFYEEICGSDERTRVCDNDCVACTLEWLRQRAREEHHETD